MSGAAIGRDRARNRGGERCVSRGTASTRCRVAAVAFLAVSAFGRSGWARAAEPVRTVVATVEARSVEEGGKLDVTGDIQARTQSDLAFRIAGKVVSRKVDLGQHVIKGDVIATLDTRQQEADLRVAQAQLTTAEAQYGPAEIEFHRQETLLTSGFTTRVRYDAAQEALRRSGADVVSAKATLATKQDALSYTMLRATADGLIVSRTVEVGQVVEAGQPVATLAEDGPRDAVFDISEAMAVRPPVDAQVTVRLTTAPGVTATGTVRTIAPAVEKASGTLRVKIGLEGQLPPEMTLGASVVGSAVFSPTEVIRLPWSSLVTSDGMPAVWTVEAAGKVSLSQVKVVRYHTGSFDIAASLPNGIRVVSAGVQFLRPGQTVDVRQGPPP